jgi:predicted outer membrane repeat protein
MGGGLLCVGSSPTITACAFRDNFAGDNGGGASCLFSSPTFVGCEFTGNAAHVGGGFLSAFPVGAPVLDGCLFAGNSAVTDGGGIYVFGTSLTVSACTIAGNSAGRSGGGIFWISAEALAVDRTVIALNAGTGAVECGFGASVPALTCSDVWGNGGGDWSGCIAAELGTSGNLSLDPLFCDTNAGVYTLSASSPCAGGGSCGRIGALDAVCGALGVEAALSPATWGRVKAFWR